ncbi:hypothetical protein [Azotobacter vinelandii]|uniref:hypothetical protein n=1 Tax=Azotobacter vinelandii TaxID=354 RepID=UPI002666D314|nr:hypothetical protein [Azotobacter vinelandii]WKN24011.1 hypothetical protein AVAEIV_002149 [Azotobacter vinelandii]
MHNFIRLFAFALLLPLLHGCATIVGDDTQVIPINSSPSDASILVTDEKGMPVYRGTTPTSVVLQKSDGSYWGKKSFTLEIRKEGYATRTIPITASANGWYIGGNILFGGLIGWFVVDPFNGSMYSLSPEQVSTSLDATGARYSPEDGLSIVLLEDVPEELRAKMRPLGR